MSLDLAPYYENIIDKLSTYFSYYFGNSFLFTRSNIRFMRRFYLQFPIYYSNLENISWEQFLLILNINDKDESLFYFFLVLFFKSNLQETFEFIENNYYNRI